MLHFFWIELSKTVHARRTNKRPQVEHQGAGKAKQGEVSSSRAFQALKRELLLRWVHWHPLADATLDFVPPSKVEHHNKIKKKLAFGHKVKKISLD